MPRERHASSCNGPRANQARERECPVAGSPRRCGPPAALPRRLRARASPPAGSPGCSRHGMSCFPLRLSRSSDVENGQLEGPADCVRAVLNVELAQDFLQVILHRGRADAEDGSDLEVALAEMDPAQDLLLARSERVDALRRRAALL